ncbi:uncharacterized protein LOC127266577 isoform X2 [Andrographis paniculata]|uniref:uncharacterized protein LOC127266577 isoform X2 n=1 Tax=Andrographis paniculata TaxID=175694 RepID=UPI0021E73993|nr:uncharacterized protein LOC127266577 isoform X2 [Andrographis paniculata]
MDDESPLNQLGHQHQSKRSRSCTNITRKSRVHTQVTSNIDLGSTSRVTVWHSEDQHVVGTSIIDVLFNRSTRGKVSSSFSST